MVLHPNLEQDFSLPVLATVGWAVMTQAFVGATNLQIYQIAIASANSLTKDRHSYLRW